MALPVYTVELLGAGSSWFDISAYVRSVTTNRGRSRELEKFEAGEFTIVLNNNNRYFDPLYTSSPYYGYIVPRRRIRIKINSVVVFNGYVGDWNLSYDVSGESTATITGFDAFIYLTNQILPTLTNASGLSGARIYALATYAGIQWPGGSLNINDGLVTVQGDTIAANTNSLEYFQLMESTERGFLFMSANNVLTYYNYASSGTPAPSVSPIVFSDSGQTAYQEIDVVYGSELLYNTVIFSRVGGGTVTVQDTASISAYGESVYTSDGLMFNSDADMSNQALMVAGKYSVPEYRFNSVTVMTNPLGSITQGYLLAIELGDFVQVNFTPNGVGSAISKYVRVIGIEHRMDIDQHYITYRFADTSGDTLILDNDALGQLDYNVLGF